MTMKQMAARCLGGMLDQVVYNFAAATRAHDEATVHKLRVSIRRLQQALRLFRQYVNLRQSKRIRKQLRAVLKAAAEVRNRDIARELLKRVNGADPVLARMEEERRAAARELHAVIARCARRADRWRAKLEIPSA